MKIKKLLITSIKALDLGSAIAVRLTKLTGKSKVAVHPKHLLTEKPWFTKYITKNDVVLDIGCGNGQNSIKAAKIAKRVVGLEISENQLQIARRSTDLEKIENVESKTGNLEEKLPFKDRTFDTILFLDVLEHLVKRDQALVEVSRVLKRNGTLLLGVPNSETSWKKLQRSVGINSFSDPDHKIEFSESSIKKLLEKHEFLITNFGYGKYDIPARGLIDIAGSLSLSFYRKVTEWRDKKSRQTPQEASGFEIVAKKK